MTNLFNKLNEYFLYDEGEKALFSEYLAFYSFLGIATTILITFTILNLTF